MNEFQSYSGDTFSKLEYHRQMGGYRPHFQGMPDDYYPLNCKEICKYVLVVLFAMSIGLGIMIAFLYWVIFGGLTGYVIAWVVFLVVAFAVLFVLFYIGGRDRITLEKKMLAESREVQEQMQHVGKKMQKYTPEQI